MKKTNKTEAVKCTDFANTIYCIRMERDITQKELAELIGVSDRTISKWENGTTVPDLETIKILCKELDISPGAIIKSERHLKDYLYIIKKNAINLFNYILKNIFLIGFIVLFALLLLYFINNFNTIKIYNITYSGDNITFENGYLFKTKVVNVLTINNIKLDKLKYEPTSVKVELYTYLNGDKYIIYEGDSLDSIIIEENKSYVELLTKDVIKNIMNNLYIKIDTLDKDNKNYSYESKLVLKQKLSNDKLAYIDYFEEYNNKEDLTTQNPFLVSLSKEYAYFDNTKPVLKEEKETNTNKLSSLGFTYDEKTDTYTKIDDDGGVIEYCPELDILKKEQLIKNIRYTTRYLIKNDYIIFNISENDIKSILKMKYMLTPKMLICIKGDCKNYKNEIDYILSVYAEIMSIL